MPIWETFPSKKKLLPKATAAQVSAGVDNHRYVTAVRAKSIATSEGIAQGADQAATYRNKVPIQQQSASSSATIDFTTGINSTYNRYLFELEDVRPATDDVILQIRITTDGGSTWKSGASDYSYSNQYSASGGAGGGINSNGATSIIMGPSGGGVGIGNASGEGLDAAYVWLIEPADTGRFAKLSWGLNWDGASAGAVQSRGGGRYNTTGAINGIRFMMSSGNIAQGRFKLWGFKDVS